MGQNITKEEAVCLLKRDLGLNSSSFTSNVPEERTNCKYFTVVVGTSWLHNLAYHGKVVVDEQYENWCQNVDRVKAVLQPTYICGVESLCKKVQITVLKKDIYFKVNSSEDAPSSSSDMTSMFDFLEKVVTKEKLNFQQYVSKFNGHVMKDNEDDDDRLRCFDMEDFRGMLDELYDISIIELNGTKSHSIDLKESNMLSNLSIAHFFPILCAVESDTAVYVVEPISYHTLADGLRYSPAVLGKNFANLMFLFYQLLDIFSSFKKYNLPLSTDIVLSDFHLLHNSLWLSISPLKCIKPMSCMEEPLAEESLVKIFDGKNTNLFASFDFTKPLSEYTRKWCNGNISNFDYIFIINILSGRKFGDPLNHPVFPWVTDFSSKYGGLRDLTKSKFRLAKGDRQLDATFSAGIGTNFPSMPIQHHVSDVLSDITYYIYHARTTSKDVLCSHVRSRWVPDEYPSTLERMYAWTPDECIPEFFYDASIFKSLHEDLPNLALPSWINSSEEFVDYHYHFLESNHVSRLLHNWIDLVFGYKLSGVAAKNEKNVHLSLVDDHHELKSYGVLQLFAFPHPERNIRSESDAYSVAFEHIEVRSRSNSWEYVDFTSSMMKGRADTLGEMVGDVDESLLGRRAKTFYEGTIGSTATTSVEDEIGISNVYQITDIQNVDFLDELLRTEKMLFHELSIHPPHSDTSLGTYKFGSAFENKVSKKYEIIEDDVKLFVCLIVEIVMEKELRLRTFVPDINVRFEEAMVFLQSAQNLPCWIKSCILDTINCCHDTVENPSEVVATYSTLSTYMNGFHFPLYFKKVHEFLFLINRAVEDFTSVLSGGDKTKLSNEIQIHAQLFPWLLDELDHEGGDMLLLYLASLFKYKDVQIPLFLHIFPSLCLVLGPIKSHVAFIRELQKVYDSIKTTEEILLLQKTFLSQALNSFGLDCFLGIFMGVVLDVLMAHQGEQIPIKVFTKYSPVGPNLPKELQFKQVTYEIPPNYEGDAESLSSFNLDDFFKENNKGSCSKNLLMLSKEYTSNISDVLYPAVSSNGVTTNEATISTPEKPPVCVSSQGEVPCQFSNFSSQEIISSSSGTIISISATSDVLPTFVYSLPHLTKQESLTSNHNNNNNTNTANNNEPDIICESQKRDLEFDRTSDNADSPFLVLSADKDDLTSSHHTVDEMLENIPQDEELLFKERTNVDELPTTGVCQTIVESVTWLVPWLGPNVSTEFVALPLLKNMSKVLLNSDGGGCTFKAIDLLMDKVSPTIECLMELALIYGDNIVFYLFLPSVSKSITSALTASSVSILLGSKLITGVQLMMESCKLLHFDNVLTYMEVLSVDFVQPLIRLLSTVKHFSAGVAVRQYLLWKVIDVLGFLSHKLNREVAQDLMAPLLQQFFSCFDGIYSLHKNTDGLNYVTRKYNLLYEKYEITPDKKGKNTNSVSELGLTMSSKHERLAKRLSIDDVLANDNFDKDNCDDQFAEIYETFSPSAAYHAYVLFCRVLGNIYIEKTLYNSDLVLQLCAKYDERLKSSKYDERLKKTASLETPTDHGDVYDNSDVKWLQPLNSTDDDERLANRSSWQHITGNWLEHWQENVKKGFSQPFYFSDRKLQAYAGHSSVIRDFYIPDNEHFFLSASRDKTVKFWLLKNHGNGTAYLGCSHTYSEHTRAVFAVQGIESKRVVASCDGTVHIWDQMTGCTVSKFDAGQGHMITSIRTLPAPSTCCAVATTEGHLRIYDIRQRKFAHTWKISPQTNAGMVRCMCVNNLGTWIAAGFSGGIVSVIDFHTGSLRAQTRVHDGEIVQMEPVPGYGFISSAVDSNLRIWNEDGSVSHILKSSSEHIHSVMYRKQQLLWATSNNKVTIHTKEKMPSFETFKISPEPFKGTLSKMAVLPISQLYLLGTDSGSIALYG